MSGPRARCKRCSGGLTRLEVGLVKNGTGRVERVCPCHRRPVAGGPARVWCRESGREWQADDLALRLVGPVLAGAVN